MLLGLFSASGAGSAHWQMDLSLMRPPLWRKIEYAPRPCPLCERQGVGDSGLNLLVDLAHHERRSAQSGLRA